MMSGIVSVALLKVCFAAKIACFLYVFLRLVILVSDLFVKYLEFYVQFSSYPV